VQKPWAALCLFSCLLAAALAGYCCGLLRQRSPSYMPAGTVPNLDYFLRTRSFSEVDNARAHLEALASQLIAEVQLARTRSRTDRRRASRPAAASSPADIPSLQRLIEQFEGTEQEAMIAAELLHAFDRAGDCHAWLDLYLATLYRHPASDVPGTFAPPALDKARAAGREFEVRNAFDHLARIPLPLRAKAPILSLLHQEPAGMSVTALSERAARDVPPDSFIHHQLD
jgi:hypothetical protein